MRHSKFLSIILLCSISFPCAFAQIEAVKSNSDSSPRKVISLRVENDIYFSDRYYTNGLKLSYTGAGDDFWTSQLQFAALRLFVSGERQAFQSVSLGQSMYVPSDIKIPNSPSWDRPYAGWLYMGFGSHLASRDTLDSFAVNLGVVGPISLAEDAQKLFHSIIDADWPMGWHNQIKNEPGIVVSYDHTERFWRENFDDTFASDILASFGADAGNVKTQGRIRGFWRFGFNMPYSFQPNRIDYSDGNDVEWRPTGESPDWHLFMYGGGAARFVANDITLNGNTFAHSVCVSPEWFVGEAMAGVSARYNFVQADLNWTLRSSEFQTQTHKIHMFWTLAVKVWF